MKKILKISLFFFFFGWISQDMQLLVYDMMSFFVAPFQNIPAKITATVNIRNLFIRFVTNSANAGDTVYSGFRAVYTS